VTTNGITPITGKTEFRSVRRNVGYELTGFATGEITSMGVGLGVVAVMDKVVPKPVRDKACEIIAKTFVEPHLDFIEKKLALCHLPECQVDETKTREERAHRLASGIYTFGTAYLVALAAKFATRESVNRLLKVPKTEAPTGPGIWNKVKPYIPIVDSSRDANMITFADEAVHFGSLIYLNTKGSPMTEDHINKMSSILQKAGMSKEKARDVSTMAMVWEVPNFLGMLSGSAAIVGKHTKGWGLDNYPVHKIMDVVNGTAMVPSRA